MNLYKKEVEIFMDFARVECVFIYFSHLLFVYLCISIIFRSPDILCFRHCAQDRLISVVSF